MSAEVRCGTCAFHVGNRCEYFKSNYGPTWIGNATRATLVDFGHGCKVWKPEEDDDDE